MDRFLCSLAACDPAPTARLYTSLGNRPRTAVFMSSKGLKARAIRPRLFSHTREQRHPLLGGEGRGEGGRYTDFV